MFHVNCSLSPNSPWKLRFFQNLQDEWKFRKETRPLWEQKPWLLQGNKNIQKPQHLHKGVLAEIEGLGFSLVLLPNCGSCICGHKTVVQRGGPLSETQKRSEKQFLSRSVLLKLIRFEWMSFSWKIGYRSWSQKLSPLCRCTKCSMLSVLSFNSPGIKLFSKKVHVGTFKEGTAFLGSDLGLRVLEMNFGPFKTEWKVLGPWSLDFCMVSTLSIKNETCARCSMLTTSLGRTPLPESSLFTQGCCSWAHFVWFRPRSVGKQQFYWKKSIGKFVS